MVNDHWSCPAPFFNFAKNLSLCICVSTCYRVIKAIFLNFFGVVCLWRSDKATLWHSTDFQRDRKWPNGQKCWFPTKNVTMSNCWPDSPGHAMPEYQSFLYYLFPHISMCSHETCINHLSFNCSMKFSRKKHPFPESLRCHERVRRSVKRRWPWTGGTVYELQIALTGVKHL